MSGFIAFNAYTPYAVSSGQSNLIQFGGRGKVKDLAQVFQEQLDTYFDVLDQDTRLGGYIALGEELFPAIAKAPQQKREALEIIGDELEHYWKRDMQELPVIDACKLYIRNAGCIPETLDAPLRQRILRDPTTRIQAYLKKYAHETLESAVMDFELSDSRVQATNLGRLGVVCADLELLKGKISTYPARHKEIWNEALEPVFIEAEDAWNRELIKTPVKILQAARKDFPKEKYQDTKVKRSLEREIIFSKHV